MSSFSYRASYFQQKLGIEVERPHTSPRIFKALYLVEVKASACNVGDLSSIPGSGRSLVKEMATHSSILAWRIPWMAELGGLQSTGRKELDTTERLHFHFQEAAKIGSS